MVVESEVCKNTFTVVSKSWGNLKGSKMGKLLWMRVEDAYEKSQTSALADEIWMYKHPGEEIDKGDREYKSWVNSLPKILNCAHDAELDELIVIFEMKTPISNKAMDVVFVGESSLHQNRVLIVELKQWNEIDINRVYDHKKVYVKGPGDLRRHPMRQLEIYENNLRNHHSGIQKATDGGMKIEMGSIAYLHNYTNKKDLYTGNYSKWASSAKWIFGAGEVEYQRLVKMLHKSFSNCRRVDLLSIMENHDAIMGDEGLAGLRKAYHNQATVTMRQDQQLITDFVTERLRSQLERPEKEMIVVSGGPGTGKTIVGIRFILEYVKLFNGGKNDNKVIFCLPKSRTVKAMFDAACAIDEEAEKEYCCYLNEIGRNQNLVVVDEAHRITKLNETLDDVFKKGTKLLILLQDDHQLVRPGEQGTFEAFREYAYDRQIRFSPIKIDDRQKLILRDEKRCDENLLQGVTKLFYDDSLTINGSIESIKVFDKLNDLVAWKNINAMSSRTKYILPFCWRWTSKFKKTTADIVIGDFRRLWNPDDPDDQVIWLNDKKDDRVACIYTSQGLDMDNVALIWWDDLIWDESKCCWMSNPTKLEDPAFQYIKDVNSGLWKETRWDKQLKRNVWVEKGLELSQKDMDQLIKNTYYVMLTRPRKKIGIWFKDVVTKKHVLNTLKLTSE